MKKQRIILIYLGVWRRAACWCVLVVGLMLACGAAMADLTPIILKHDDAVLSVAFSPDGKLLATGSDDGTTKVWEMPLGKPLAMPKPPAPVLSTPENGTIFTQTFPTLKWDASVTLYQLQIAKDAKFRQIVWERDISGTEYSLSSDDLGNGTYYWRVADVGGIVRSEWSKVHSFKIISPNVSVQISRQSGLDATVEIQIEHAKDLYGFQFSLNFDSDLLEVVKVEQGKFLGKNISWNAPEIDNDRGRISGATAMKTGGGGSSGKGVLAKIEFKAKRLKGSSELILRDVNLLNPSGDYIQRYFIEQVSISFPAGQK